MPRSRKLPAAILAGLIALVATAALAAEGATDAAIAALESSLGGPRDLEVDEVRITDRGVACIEYRVRDESGKQALGHAVVQGKDVLRSPSNQGEKFEKAWDEHCLGPRGGITTDQ